MPVKFEQVLPGITLFLDRHTPVKIGDVDHERGIALVYESEKLGARIVKPEYFKRLYRTAARAKQVLKKEKEKEKEG